MNEVSVVSIESVVKGQMYCVHYKCCTKGECCEFFTVPLENTAS